MLQSTRRTLKRKIEDDADKPACKKKTTMASATSSEVCHPSVCGVSSDVTTTTTTTTSSEDSEATSSKVCEPTMVTSAVDVIQCSSTEETVVIPLAKLNRMKKLIISYRSQLRKKKLTIKFFRSVRKLLRYMLQSYELRSSDTIRSLFFTCFGFRAFPSFSEPLSHRHHGFRLCHRLAATSVQ